MLLENRINQVGDVYVYLSRKYPDFPRRVSFNEFWCLIYDGFLETHTMHSTKIMSTEFKEAADMLGLSVAYPYFGRISFENLQMEI